MQQFPLSIDDDQRTIFGVYEAFLVRTFMQPVCDKALQCVEKCEVAGCERWFALRTEEVQCLTTPLILSDRPENVCEQRLLL